MDDLVCVSLYSLVFTLYFDSGLLCDLTSLMGLKRIVTFFILLSFLLGVRTKLLGNF